MGRTNGYNFTPEWFGKCGAISNLATQNFTLGGEHFGIDNENDEAVFLEVKFVEGTEFINKKFLPGPNPYLIKEVKTNTTLTADQLSKLKWGR